MATHNSSQPADSRVNDFPQNFFDKYRKSGATRDGGKMQECFRTFDTDRDGYLNTLEFDGLLSQLFSKRGKPYLLTDSQRTELFNLVDSNKILDPVTALIIVDVQNDFISGSLAIQEGELIVSPINNILDTYKFDLVVYTLDWHPHDHISFVENVKKREIDPASKVKAEHAKVQDEVIFRIPGYEEGRIQTVWPRHCVQNTEGAKLHKDLKLLNNALYINKGTDPDIDSYSAFWDNGKLRQTQLEAELRKRKVTDVYVCGLAIDICVRFTSLDSIAHGFRTILIDSACKGVDQQSVEPSREQIRKSGGLCIDICEMGDIYSLVDRRPEIGLHAARTALGGKKCDEIERRVITQ
ncbi:uncharacterized protein LOC106152128 [Lingula anatina]|uniref:nicotinamidase n=1 Tax=Lingula anatina TaxID=7574 RepID=A0A1S3H4L7_LINAN|nr:uncharacterized protein LOC106152128 [Lingula anatina]|eukprot:XP_013381075.1 uncharacterized protein LOC106152128 [Lingula anatina]